MKASELTTLNYSLLKLQYCKILKIGFDLGLITKADSGLKDFELTRRMIDRAIEKGIIKQLIGASDESK